MFHGLVPAMARRTPRGFFFSIGNMTERSPCTVNIYVAVNFLSQVIFVFLLVLGMVIYNNEVETKEK